jgi:hypothetical protein
MLTVRYPVEVDNKTHPFPSSDIPLLALKNGWRNSPVRANLSIYETTFLSYHHDCERDDG